MNALVIFLEIPDDVYCYQLNDLTGSQYAQLKTFHNHYVNSTGTPNDVQDQINDFFYNSEGKLKFKDTKEPLLNVKFDIVIRTGFIL